MISENNTDKQKQIAKAFSNGNFEIAFPYLSETIEWNKIGEETLVGKDNVIDNCKEVLKYFETMTTKFNTLNIVAENNLVVVNGTGEFLSDGKRLSFASASDVYTFNDNNELQRIDSYCIYSE